MRRILWLISGRLTFSDAENPWSEITARVGTYKEQLIAHIVSWRLFQQVKVIHFVFVWLLTSMNLVVQWWDRSTVALTISTSVSPGDWMTWHPLFVSAVLMRALFLSRDKKSSFLPENTVFLQFRRGYRIFPRLSGVLSFIERSLP